MVEAADEQDEEKGEDVEAAAAAAVLVCELMVLTLASSFSFSFASSSATGYPNQLSHVRYPSRSRWLEGWCLIRSTLTARVSS